MSRESIAAVLRKYLPPSTVEICTSWIVQKNIHLKITKSRSSRFGDYRPLEKGKGHQITVNHNLNQYSFLVTFLHEVAHLHVQNKFPRYTEPHGKEWKNEFRNILYDFLVQKIFPQDIEDALVNYFQDPAASTCSDPHLYRALKKYDSGKNAECKHLEELPEGTHFRILSSKTAMIFKKGLRRRTRFHCVEVQTRREYYVSGIAEVIPIADG